MLKLPDEAEQDILNFMKKLDNLRDQDIKQALRLMIAKYLQITESDYMLTRHNLHDIINGAKTNYINLPVEVYLDGLQEKHKIKQGRLAEEDELRIISITQAVVCELRKQKVLGRPVKFNFKKR